MTVMAKIKFTVVAVNTSTLPLGLTHPLIFCWDFISINSFFRVLLAIGIQLTSQECETPVYQEWVTYNIHTPWSRILLEKRTRSQLVKKFPAFYRTQSFITTLTSACHLFLSWARSIQSPHPTSWRSILILSSYLCLGLPNKLFPSGIPTKPYIHTTSLSQKLPDKQALKTQPSTGYITPLKIGINSIIFKYSVCTVQYTLRPSQTPIC